MKANLIKSHRGELPPLPDTVNNAGGLAYKHDDYLAITQMALTGTLSDTFYVSAENQLEPILQLCDKVDVEFLAKLAVYARAKGNMRDMPALLAAAVAARDPSLLPKIWKRVINNRGMVRKFVKFIRSGLTGRKSFGSGPKRLIANWLLDLSPSEFLSAYVGNDPSMGDIIKMIRPAPRTPEQAAMFAWAIGADYDPEQLPDVIKGVRNFNLGLTTELPIAPFEMLAASPKMTPAHWVTLTRRLTWTQLVSNLNTLERHGVLSNPTTVGYIVTILVNKDLIVKARPMPYRLLTTYNETKGVVPTSISVAIQQALEIVLWNVPKLPSDATIFCDVSGSMRNPVTKQNETVQSKIRNVDIAALFTLALVRKNFDVKSFAFDHHLYEIYKGLNPVDSLVSITNNLAAINGGGTDTRLPFIYLLQQQIKTNLIIIVSDNESWSNRNSYNRREFFEQGVYPLWKQYLAFNPDARLVCLDISPNNTSPIKSSESSFNIGGFSDNVFDLISDIANGGGTTDYMVEQVAKVELNLLGRGFTKPIMHIDG
jgi:60 kDa SS-A/Ro ribonucleoprotein